MRSFASSWFLSRRSSWLRLSGAATKTVAIALIALAAGNAQALIHQNGDDPAYYQNPGNGIPWDNVGRLTADTNGNGTNGSVVSLTGKYCLTADHVVTNNYVTFDGDTYYKVDKTFPYTRIGTADLRLFKLEEDPGLPTLAINGTASADANPATMHLVSWGYGINPAQPAPLTIGNFPIVWQWGGEPTIAKRWGTNSAYALVMLTNSTHQYYSIYVSMRSNSGRSTDAALAMLDSGSPSFIFYNNAWYLNGIATQASSVAGANTSSFGTSATYRDAARWVRLAAVKAAIEAAVPNPALFSGWLIDNGLSGSNAAADADPDGDGIPNLMEFAFGTNPKAREPNYFPQLRSKSNGDVVYSYRQSKLALGITSTVMHSDDMLTWSPAGGTPVVVNETDAHIDYELPVSPTNTTHRFYRVRVTETAN